MRHLCYINYDLTHVSIESSHKRIIRMIPPSYTINLRPNKNHILNGHWLTFINITPTTSVSVSYIIILIIIIVIISSSNEINTVTWMNLIKSSNHFSYCINSLGKAIKAIISFISFSLFLCCQP